MQNLSMVSLEERKYWTRVINFLEDRKGESLYYAIQKFGDKKLRIDQGFYKKVLVHEDCKFVLKFADDRNNEMFEMENKVYAAALLEGIDRHFLRNIPFYEHFFLQQKAQYILGKRNPDGSVYGDFLEYSAQRRLIEGEDFDIDRCAHEYYGMCGGLFYGITVYDLDDYMSYCHIADFLDEQDITDLHSYNIGIIDGEWVIIDCWSDQNLYS